MFTLFELNFFIIIFDVQGSRHRSGGSCAVRKERDGRNKFENNIIFAKRFRYSDSVYVHSTQVRHRKSKKKKGSKLIYFIIVRGTRVYSAIILLHTRQ